MLVTRSCNDYYACVTLINSLTATLFDNFNIGHQYFDVSGACALGSVIVLCPPLGWTFIGLLLIVPTVGFHVSLIFTVPTLPHPMALIIHVTTFSTTIAHDA